MGESGWIYGSGQIWRGGDRAGRRGEEDLPSEIDERG